MRRNFNSIEHINHASLAANSAANALGLDGKNKCKYDAVSPFARKIASPGAGCR